MFRREIIGLSPNRFGDRPVVSFSLNARGGKPHYAKNEYLHIISPACRIFGSLNGSFGFIAYPKRVYWPLSRQK
jgi:hypothetical protein